MGDKRTRVGRIIVGRSGGNGSHPNVPVSPETSASKIVLGSTMKKVLLILYRAPPATDNAMTLKAITSSGEGTCLGYRRGKYDKSIRRLRTLRLVETLKHSGHRSYHYRLTQRGRILAENLRTSIKAEVEEFARLL